MPNIAISMYLTNEEMVVWIEYDMELKKKVRDLIREELTKKIEKRETQDVLDNPS